MKRLMIAGALALWSLPLLAAPGHDYAFGKPAAAAQATRTVEVVMGDMYFEPRALTVKAGETVRFVLVNKGQVAHEFNLGDAAMHARHQEQMVAMQGQMDPSGMAHGNMDHGATGHAGMQHDDPNMVMVEPGQRAELTWAFSQSTPIQFACNVPGHYQAGMLGTLTIVE